MSIYLNKELIFIRNYTFLGDLIEMKEDTNATILLNGTDPSGRILSVVISSLPIYGDIYLAKKIAENGQVKFAVGNKILTVPTALQPGENVVIYNPP